MALLKKLFVFLIEYSLLCDSLVLQSLTGKWLLNDLMGEYTNLTATVPGGIYTDLMANNIIGNIFYGYNDVKTRWVAKRNWVYSKMFIVDNKLLIHEQINLVINGVDTFSKIRINDVAIGKTDNMFVRYEFDIKKYLKIGKNKIVIQFSSPIAVAKRFYEEYLKNYNYTAHPICVPDHYQGECHVNYIRKMQISFSWDFGPAFPSVGLWKNIYLEAFNSSIIRDVTLSTKLNKTNWDFSVSTYLIKNDFKKLNGNLMITIITDLKKMQFLHPINFNFPKNEFIFVHNFSIPESHFKLWWPNGFGKQHLYKLEVVFTNQDKSENCKKKIKIGLRTIEIIENELRQGGKMFYFKVNSVPIFIKGANIIPFHILPEEAQNEARIRYLLESSRDVHMNMLRVWGGGSYESNTFYEIADELGILIWQDFMFACSMYPANDEFLITVIEEVKQQVRRLQHHPCIAIWNGNNEIEMALNFGWYNTTSNYEQYVQDYIKLYIKTIKRVVFENDNTRHFLVSSPTNGIQNNDNLNSNPQDTLMGNVHFYNYDENGWDTNIYPIPRFVSEYGYQSYPSIKTLLSATYKESDININGNFLKHRQHHQNTVKLIEEQFILENISDAQYTKDYIFYSQIIQAMSVKIETEFYRQWRGYVTQYGEGGTMGALYWQLNDVWAAPTWSSIDFNGNWKMLHYYAKDFFAPVIVTSKILNKYFIVYVISDLLQPVIETTLTIYTYNWNSFIPLKTEDIRLDILPGSSKIVKNISLAKYLWETKKCGPKIYNAIYNCFLYFTLNCKSKQIAPNNILLPAPIQYTSIGHSYVQIDVKKISINKFILNVTSKEIAAFVWLESEVLGTFSENGFFQLSPHKIVEFTSKIEAQYKSAAFSVQNYIQNKQKYNTAAYCANYKVLINLNLCFSIFINFLQCNLNI